MRRRLIVVLLHGAALTSAVNADIQAESGSESPRLRLLVGDIDVSGLPDLRDVGGKRPLPKGMSVCLCVDGPLTPGQIAELAKAGVGVGAYLPDRAYMSKIEPDALEALGTFGWVRRVVEWRDEWKVDPSLRAFPPQVPVPVAIYGFQGAEPGMLAAAVSKAIGREPSGVSAVGQLPVVGAMVAPGELDALAARVEVAFIELRPGSESRSNSNTRWIIQSNQPGLTPLYALGIAGTGQVLGLMDDPVDPNHCSFRDTAVAIVGPGYYPTHRKILAYNGQSGATAHGTHVACTAMGANGLLADDLRGIAYGSKLVYSPRPLTGDVGLYATLLLHHDQGARVHSNSWGNDLTRGYDLWSRSIDEYCYTYEDGMVVVAVSNGQLVTNPENAKSAVGVGATGGSGSQGSFCSGGTGPTLDGRRKPELFAPGCATVSASAGTSCGTRSLSGTSMAAPAVAGAAMLAREYFMRGFHINGTESPSDGFTPTGSLIRAALVAASEDISGLPGWAPTPAEGWGRVNLSRSLSITPGGRRLLVDDVRRGNARSINASDARAVVVGVSSSVEPLSVVLAFADPAPAVGSAQSRVNDLDLLLRSPSGRVFTGNSFDGGSSWTVAGGNADPVNTVEVVRVATPEPGTWTIEVRGTEVNAPNQGYAVICVGSLASAFPMEPCCRGATCGSVRVSQCESTVQGVGSKRASGVCGLPGVCCFADFDQNGRREVDDIFTFLSAWFDNSPFAQVGGDGSGSRSLGDVFAFLTAWFTGC